MFLNYFLYLLATIFIINYVRLVNLLHEIFDDTSYSSRDDYDWVIVGSGTAGSLIAAGIENDDVLIVEAGHDSNAVFDIPLISPLIQKTSASWNYLTAQQDNACLALNEHRSAWPMGKVRGGSHILNNMIHYRGHPDDFKGWFSDSDYNKYNYERDILPYFIASEKYLSIVEAKYCTKLGYNLLKSTKDFGYVNEFSIPNVTQKEGLRWTTSHSGKREKQEMLLNALVTRIIFENATDRASGIEYFSKGVHKVIHARKGVIISAGTIGTAKLLLQSGIGPADDLKSLNIRVRKDLPVGRNLQDHVATGLDLVLLKADLGLSPLDVLSPKNLINFFYHKTGENPLSHAGCDLLGFINTNESSTEPPDLGYMAIAAGISTDAGVIFNEIININRTTWSKYFAPLIGQTAVSIMPIVLHPKSVGWVKLSSKDPFDDPYIQPNYLSHSDDVKVLVKGLKILEQLLMMPAMKELGAELNPKNFPGCEEFHFGSDEYWECYIRHLTLTVYHPVGTCKFGSISDPTTVVSSDTFQVHNMLNLYVVDASLMPNLPSGNPNSVISMLAMKFLSTINK